MTKLVIERAKWSAGHLKRVSDLGENALRNRDGTMCCLGFYARQVCGLKVKDITGVGLPCEVEIWPESDVCLDTEINFAQEAVAINDTSSINRRERETNIRKHFAAKGIKVTFTGKYPK